MKITSTICLNRGDDELQLKIVAEYSPGCDGHYSGSPQNCYPAEPDLIEDIHATYEGKEVELSSEEYEYIQKQLEKEFCKARY